MHGARYVQKQLLDRFSGKNPDEEDHGSLFFDAAYDDPQRVNRFLRIAECRKRQILEKMLME